MLCVAQLPDTHPKTAHECLEPERKFAAPPPALLHVFQELPTCIGGLELHISALWIRERIVDRQKLESQSSQVELCALCDPT